MTETTKQVTEKLYEVYKGSFVALLTEDAAAAKDLFEKHMNELRRIKEAGKV